MRTVLMFTRFFPPMYSVGGKRAYRFARYLPRHGWRPVVVTAPVQRGRPVDPTAGLPLDPTVVVHRTYYPDLGWLVGPLVARFPWLDRGGLSDGTVSRPIGERSYPPGGLLGRLAWQAAVPLGPEVVNLPRWSLLASRLARRHRADAIFATSGPVSALALGAAARAVTGLPLCLDLRDPWSLNFGQERRPPWVRAVERRAEGSILGSADRVTFTCNSVIEAYREAFPGLERASLACIYNSFDPEQEPAAAPAPSGPVRLAHFGNVYGGRTLEPVIRALARLRESRGVGPEQVVVENLGRLSGTDLRLAGSLGVGDMIRHRTFVPYRDGLDILASADRLLLLSYGEETLYVPAKLYDYLLAGRPILCVAPPSELAGIVRETRSGQVVAPDDIPSMVEAIEQAMAERRGTRPGMERDHEEIARFSAPRTAEQLARILDEMVDSRETTA